MTLLVAGGDSFTFGNELKDDNPGPSPNAWCSLLANNLNWQCVNTSLGGSGNSSIARKIINACERHSDQSVFVIAMWTFPARFEFRFNYETNSRDTPWKSVSAWDLESYEEKIKKFKLANKVKNDLKGHSNFLDGSGMRKFLKQFYKHVGGNGIYEHYNTYKEIVLLQNYCKIKNIPYVFTLMDNYTIKHSCNDQSVDSLYNCIDFTKFFLFDDELGFDQWAWKNNYPRGDFHPLDQAHIDAAKLIEGKVNEILGKN